VHRDLIGVAQPVGDDGRAARVDAHDEAVVAAAPVAQRARLQPGADGDPEAAGAVLDHEVGGRQVHAVRLLQPGPHLPVALQMEHPAVVLAQVRQQEAAVGPQRDAVGSQRDAVRPGARIERLAAVGPQMGHAAAPVGAEQIARGRGQHTLGPHQTVSDEAQRLQRGSGLGRRQGIRRRVH
jgi:hypothetical protein